MKHYGDQIPAKPVLRKCARCIEHKVWKTEYFLSKNLTLINSNKFLRHFIIKTYNFSRNRVALDVWQKLTDMLTLRTTFSVYSRVYVIQGSSVWQTLFKKETACHGIDRHKLPTKRCTLRQTGKVMTQWWKKRVTSKIGIWIADC